MTEFLPGWVVVGAECLLTWGLRDEHVEKVTITKITPSGQVVLNGQSKGERRFMRRDFQSDGTAHKYVGGTFSTGSLDLYPMDHPKVPKLIAKGEEASIWSSVRLLMQRIEREPTPKKARMLRNALEAWERAVQRVEDA
jgi:hypothetical protein